MKRPFVIFYALIIYAIAELFWWGYMLVKSQPGRTGMIMGEGLDLMTGARGASNARARQELGWILRYPSWRQGFPASYAALEAAVTRAAS